MAVHGEVRGTDDFDVWVDATEENARRVLRYAIDGVTFDEAWPERVMADDESARARLARFHGAQ